MAALSEAKVRQNKTRLMVRREVGRLMDISKSGLPPIYSEKPVFSPWEDFLCDYWPDYPWNPVHMLHTLEAVTSDPEWQAAADAVRIKHGYDFKREHYECIASLRNPNDEAYAFGEAL